MINEIKKFYLPSKPYQDMSYKELIKESNRLAVLIKKIKKGMHGRKRRKNNKAS